MSDDRVQPLIRPEIKKEFLREWARNISAGDPARLPVIREARQTLSDRFGETLATDTIGEILRDLRQDLKQSAPVAVQAPPSSHLDNLAQILQLMRDEGIEYVKIDREGVLQELRRLPKAPTPSHTEGK